MIALFYVNSKSCVWSIRHWILKLIFGLLVFIFHISIGSDQVKTAKVVSREKEKSGNSS